MVQVLNQTNVNIFQEPGSTQEWSSLGCEKWMMFHLKTLFFAPCHDSDIIHTAPEWMVYVFWMYSRLSCEATLKLGCGDASLQQNDLGK